MHSQPIPSSWKKKGVRKRILPISFRPKARRRNAEASAINKMDTTHPTPYPEVNRVLLELLSDVQTVLGDHFVGMYLCGSLAGGDFDQDSDLDFVVATNDDIFDTLFSGFHTAHMRIATIECLCATELERGQLRWRDVRS